ncbi:hypothetical protein EDC01DRAFT_776634 [Geopyxis carbonaria]|nr:hypothetical protein EDC01DRAFT_776634 [Geopyxis carbonaria]
MPTSTTTTQPSIGSRLVDDAYISSLEAKLLLFERQRTTLQSELVTLKSSHTLSSTVLPSSIDDEYATPPSSLASTIVDPAPHPSDDEILSLALSRSSALNTHNLTRLHRLAGVTTFRMREPGQGGENLLGVRIEAFSQSKRSFEKPEYLFLRLDGNESWVLVRHSVPAFVGTAKLAEMYLPLPAKGAPRPVQKLDELIKQVRLRILKWRRREEMVESIRASAKAAGTVGDVTESWTVRVDSVWWDKEVTKVEIRWGNGMLVEMAVDATGDITKAVMKNRKGDRKRDIERTLIGPLESLPTKMGWIN